MDNIPGRVFLDTSVINFMLDYGEQIYDNTGLPDGTASRILDDVHAMRAIYITGQRAAWQLAVSPYTFKEIIQTRDLGHHTRLKNWFFDLWYYWQDILDTSSDLPTFVEAERTRVDLLASGLLDELPDLEDRLLISDAVVYRCELFCTRDWKTILKYRDALEGLPLGIVTPAEWWNIIRPWAGIWA